MQENLHKQTGQIRNDVGMFIFKTIYPLVQISGSGTDSGLITDNKLVISDHKAYHWYLVSLVPEQTIASYSNRLMAKSFVLGVIFPAGCRCFLDYFLAIIQRMIEQAQLKLLALFDPLTELPNRRLFFDRLVMVLRHGCRNKTVFALLYLDLDGFKGVNDMSGHETGVSLFPSDAVTAEELLKFADKAMYVSKNRGKNRYTFCSVEEL